MTTGDKSALAFTAQQTRGLADNGGFAFRRRSAGECEIGLGQFAGCRMITHRRQQRPCGNLTGSYQLLDLEDVYVLPGIIGFGVSDNGMCCAKIDTD